MSTVDDAAIGASGRLRAGLGPNYWRCWASSAASNLADGMFWIAFPLLAIRLTDSPVLIAGVAVVGRLPWLVFVLFAGALADRLDRRRTMIGVSRPADVVSRGHRRRRSSPAPQPVASCTSTAFVLGVGETLFDTAAQSIMPSVVDRDDLLEGERPAVRGRADDEPVRRPAARRLPGRRSRSRSRSPARRSRSRSRAVALSLAHRLVQARPRRPEAREAERRRATSARGCATCSTTACCGRWRSWSASMNLASSAAFAVFVLYAVAPGPMGLDAFGFGVLTTRMAIGSLVGSLVVDAWSAGWAGRGSCSSAVHRSARSPRGPGPHGEPVDRRRCRSPSAACASCVERRHGVAAPADRPGRAPRPAQRELPAARLGHAADRRAARRPHRPGVRAAG